MRYRVHRHCRRLDCTEWCVSTNLHVVIYTTYSWLSAWSWTCARLRREALTTKTASWGNPVLPTAEARAEAIAEFYASSHPIIAGVGPSQEYATRFLQPGEDPILDAGQIGIRGYDVRAGDGKHRFSELVNLPVQSITMPPLLSRDRGLITTFSGGDMTIKDELMRRATTTWPEPVRERRDLSFDIITPVQGEFATDDGPNPANECQNRGCEGCFEADLNGFDYPQCRVMDEKRCGT